MFENKSLPFNDKIPPEKSFPKKSKGKSKGSFAFKKTKGNIILFPKKS
jgi:hypothetical protein